MTDLRLEQKLGFDTVRALIQGRCCTEYAAARVEQESFCTEASEIRRRLVLTDEMRLILMFEDAFPTNGYVDCLPFLEGLEKNGCLDALSIGKLRTMLDTLAKALHFFHNIKEGIYPNLQKSASGISACTDVRRRIDSILDKYGEVKDTASNELYTIRKSIKDKEMSMSKRMNAILRQARTDGLVEADAAVSIRDGKMLIPVNSSKKRQFPGLVYDESASGRTTFMEPAEIVALTNEISELHFAETREIARILREFSDTIRPMCPELQAAARFMGELDFIMAKAHVALDFVAGMPVISEDGSMNLRKARHPLLERSLRKEKKAIVPLTVTLTPGQRIILISGPNAGGKSVCLKTVGLLQYMFQWGMLIPTSESSEMPVFERIMLSIGDDQSLENDLSTYSSFLADMGSMLDGAGAGTLILIDEFGSGTEPAAGGAIAEALLYEFDVKGCYGVITTHYTNLKLYASDPASGVVNAAMLFDEATVAPLFKLEIGLPGSSFAFELARKMGLPEDLVRDAEQRSGEGFVGMERNLRKIARSRRALDEKLSKVKAADKTLDSLTDRYEKELEDIKAMRKRILDEARLEAEKMIREANRQVENTIRTIRESQAEKEQTREARANLGSFLGALVENRKDREEYLDRNLEKVRRRKEEQVARKKRRHEEETLPEGEAESAKEKAFRSAPLKVGEKVRIKENGMVGEVSKVSAKAVTVIVGNISTKLPADKVERITANEFKAASKPSARPRQVIDSSIAERKARFTTQLDVRGMRVGEAMEVVMRYIDDALMLDVPSVRILHGKGTGALHEEIQKYARSVPGVTLVRDEDVQLGGSGVTIVSFR